METLKLVEPKCVPPLDADFRPAVLANHAFRKEVADSGAGLAWNDRTASFRTLKRSSFPKVIREPRLT
jgi:hypothetical protein